MVCNRWRCSKHVYYVSKVLHVIRSFSDSIPPFMILLSLGYASSSIYSIDILLGVLLYSWWLEVHTGSTKCFQLVLRTHPRLTRTNRSAL
jgi:hypothetical protein